MSLSFKIKLLRDDIDIAVIPTIPSKSLLSPPIVNRPSVQSIVNDIRVSFTLRSDIGETIPTIVTIAAGLWCNYIVMSDGTVWAFGDEDWLGACDGRTAGDSNTPVKMNMTNMYWRDDADGWELDYPYQMNGEVPNKIVYVNATENGFMSYFIDSAGQAWSIGDAGYGRCGDGENGSAWHECFFPAGGETFGEKSYTKISVNDQGGGIGIDTSGLLWTWGTNRYAAVGNGMNPAYDSWTYVNLPFNPTQGGRTGTIDITGKTWLDCAGGWYGSAAIDSSGQLWCWGHNVDGQCGQGISYSYPADAYWPYPTQVGTDTDWVSVQGGTYGWCAQKEDGTLWFWGDNSQGFMDGTTTDRYSPSLVQGGSWDTLWRYNYYWLIANKNGSTFVWGVDIGGNLGQGDELDYLTPVAFSVNFIMFDTHSWGGLGMDADYNIWMWGDNLGGTINGSWPNYYAIDPPQMIDFDWTATEE